MKSLKFFIILILVSIFVAFPLYTNAQFNPATFPRGGTGSDVPIDESPPGSDVLKLNPEFKNPLGAKTIMELIDRVIEILVAVGIPIAVLFLVYAGFLFVTARGNEEQLKKAKGVLLWTIVGIAILLGAKIISTVLENTITNITG